MYGNEIKAVLFLEERAWIVGLNPVPRLSKGAQHDDEGVTVLPCNRRSRGKGSILIAQPSKRRSEAKRGSGEMEMSSAIQGAKGYCKVFLGSACTSRQLRAQCKSKAMVA